MSIVEEATLAAKKLLYWRNILKQNASGHTVQSECKQRSMVHMTMLKMDVSNLSNDCFGVGYVEQSSCCRVSAGTCHLLRK